MKPYTTLSEVKAATDRLRCDPWCGCMRCQIADRLLASVNEAREQVTRLTGAVTDEEIWYFTNEIEAVENDPVRSALTDFVERRKLGPETWDVLHKDIR